MKQDVLSHLKEMLGLEDSELPEFYDSFMQSFGECAEELRNLSSPSEFMEIRRVTHAIFGFSQSVNAMDLYEVSKDLNAAAKAEDPVQCANQISALLAVYDAYRAEA